MNVLNLTAIKYFCDAVRFGSIAAAAKANFVTQSAVSQAIAKFERSLGVSLLSHHPNRFRVTPEGESLMEQFMILLKYSEEIQNSVSEGKIDYIGDLTFSSSYSFALAVIPEYLKRFITDYPQVKINFSLSSPDVVKEDVKNGKIDFGILPDIGDLDKFDLRKIYSGKYRVYTSAKISPKEKSALRFILTEKTSKETIYLKNAYRKKFKKELTNYIEVDSWEMIAKLTSQGLGIGYLPDYFAQERSDLSLQEYDLGLKVEEYQMVAIAPKGMKLRKSSEIFLSYLHSNA